MLEARLLSDTSQEKFSEARLNPGKTSPSPVKSKQTDQGSQGEGEDRDLRRHRQFATLAGGVATSLRTLVMATFRSASLVEGITVDDCCEGDKAKDTHTTWDALNPTAALLRASVFVASQPKVFALVCLLNANMNAVDLTTRKAPSTREILKGSVSDENEEDNEEESGSELLRRNKANSLLHDLAHQAASMSPEALAKTLAYVQSDVHGLPVQRDVPSYAAVLSVLENASKNDNAMPRTPPRGRAQAKREAKGYRYNFNDGNEDDEDDDEEPLGRSQMKSEASARALRLQEQKQSEQQGQQYTLHQEFQVDDEDENDELQQGSEHLEHQKYSNHLSLSADAKEDISGASEAKRLAGTSQHAVSPARDTMEGRFRLLGDLPSLRLQWNNSQVHSRNDGSTSDRDDTGSGRSLLLSSTSSKDAKQASSTNSPHSTTAMNPSRAPLELCCAINGHVMKEPVRARDSNLVFERATIRLWLSTRGSVCPITHSPLTENDLAPDVALRSKVITTEVRSKSHKSSFHHICNFNSIVLASIDHAVADWCAALIKGIS